MWDRQKLFKLKGQFLSVWPDVRIKSSPKCSSSCPKSNHSSFCLKSYDFQKAIKSQIFGLLLQENLWQKSANLITLVSMENKNCWKSSVLSVELRSIMALSAKIGKSHFVKSSDRQEGFFTFLKLYSQVK